MMVLPQLGHVLPLHGQFPSNNTHVVSQEECDAAPALVRPSPRRTVEEARLGARDVPQVSVVGPSEDHRCDHVDREGGGDQDVAVR